MTSSVKLFTLFTNPMKSFFLFLKRSFPYPNTKKSKFFISLYCSILTFVMIILFKPGQRNPLPVIENISSAIIYSITVFLILTISQVFFQGVFIKNKVSYSKLIIWVLFNSILIGNSNAILSFVIFRNEATLYNYLEVFMGTVSTASIISILISLVYQNFILKKKMYNIHISETQAQKITIPADNPKNNVVIENIQLLYIEALENYIIINYLDKQDQLKKYTLRVTMKKTVECLKQCPEFLHCHRSFIVNKNHISQLKRNANRIELVLGKNNIIIPVSRKKYSKIRTHIKIV